MVFTDVGQNEHIEAFDIVWMMNLGGGMDWKGVLLTTRRQESPLPFLAYFDYQAEMMQYIQMKCYAGNPTTQIANIDINE